MTSAQQHDKLLEEAAEWMALLHSGEATDDDHRRLQQWCQRSDAHHQTWQRAESLLGSLGQLPADIARPTLQRLHSQNRRKTLKVLSLLALGVPLTALTASQLPWGVWQADLRTATGEQSRLTLADGSALVLNTATAINLAFSAQQRRLELKEGELLLSTAPDPLTPERPLVISTREGLIETRNARLSVQQRARDTRVAVFSGTALLHGAGLAQQVELNAGQQRQLSLGAISAPTPANEQSLLWQQGMLLAIDMPLGALTEELGRYRSGVVRCDPAVASIVVSGAFSLRDTDASLALLQKTLPVRVQQLGPWWVTIKPA